MTDMLANLDLLLRCGRERRTITVSILNAPDASIGLDVDPVSGFHDSDGQCLATAALRLTESNLSAVLTTCFHGTMTLTVDGEV